MIVWEHACTNSFRNSEFGVLRIWNFRNLKIATSELRNFEKSTLQNSEVTKSFFSFGKAGPEAI